MLLFFIAIVVGLGLLVWSADRFVAGSVATALHLGMTPMMIGVTIVAFGTSAPELIVSATAALENASDLAVGNAIGSNIANIGLVLGATALISAIPLRKSILKVEFPVLMLATLAASALIYDGQLLALDGIALLVILGLSLFALAKMQSERSVDIDEIEEGKSLSKLQGWVQLFVGLIILLASSKVLVWGATGIATTLGVSELVIGLTIIAIGTSLPELAASVASALKGHHDMALGNVIGSNLFNLLAVLAIPALINPPSLEGPVLYRDYASMLAFTFGLALLVYLKYATRHYSISKFAGIILLSGYATYLYILYLQTNPLTQ